VSPTPVWVAYGLVSANDLFCYQLQRTALMVCRVSGLAPEARVLMLPNWYATATPTQIAKLICAVLIFISVSWWATVLALVVPVAAIPMLPVDHAANVNRMRRHVQSSRTGLDLHEAGVLLNALEKYEAASREAYQRRQAL